MRKVVEYYDNWVEKDETKEYKLVKRVSTKDTLYLYNESILKEVDKETELLKSKVVELDSVMEDVMITILDFI